MRGSDHKEDSVVVATSEREKYAEKLKRLAGEYHEMLEKRRNADVIFDDELLVKKFSYILTQFNYLLCVVQELGDRIAEKQGGPTPADREIRAHLDARLRELSELFGPVYPELDALGGNLDDKADH